MHIEHLGLQERMGAYVPGWVCRRKHLIGVRRVVMCSRGCTRARLHVTGLEAYKSCLIEGVLCVPL